MHTWGVYEIICCVQMIVEDAHLASETDSEKDESSEESDRITTVMFYSITSTQKGKTSLCRDICKVSLIRKLLFSLLWCNLFLTVLLDVNTF